MIKWQIKNKAITGYIILFIWLFSFNPTIHAQTNLFSIPQKVKTQPTFSNRYIILIDGVNSFSSGSSPLNGDFEFIENQLIKKGVSNSNIVYFSYSAKTKDKYCLGWKDACSTTGDLSYLYLFPVYSKGDTHLKISDQARVLEWVVEQIVKKDSNAQIDIIGFSQGGIIAAYWGSHIGKSSTNRSKIHGIITLESPLGGIPMAEQCVGSLTLPICPFLRLHYGDELLRVLQMPGSLPDSIVDELPDVSSYFSFTSIQSSTDYTVNGISFPIDWTIHGHQDALIGNGSQSWVSSKQLLLMDKCEPTVHR